MSRREVIRDVVIKFNTWLYSNAFYSVSGWILVPDLDEEYDDNNEYEIDELFDYWYDNVNKDEKG